MLNLFAPFVTNGFPNRDESHRNEKYGIALDTTSEDKKGAKLLIVKNRRNALAHGGQSFIQIGRDTSIDELIAIKNQTILFLENFLQCTRAYLEQQHYQLEPDAQG